MLPASKGSPLETSPCLPETGSCAYASLLAVVVVCVAMAGFSFSLVLLLSPQTTLAAALAMLFIASMAIDLRLTIRGDVITTMACLLQSDVWNVQSRVRVCVCVYVVVGLGVE